MYSVLSLLTLAQNCLATPLSQQSESKMRISFLSQHLAQI